MAVRFGLVWTALGLRVGALHSRSYLPTFRTTSAQTCADPMFPACFKVSPFEGHSGNPESTILNLFKRPICFQVFFLQSGSISHPWFVWMDYSGRPPGRISCTSGYPTGTILKSWVQGARLHTRSTPGNLKCYTDGLFISCEQLVVILLFEACSS